jgi:hypothetical protein
MTGEIIMAIGIQNPHTVTYYAAVLEAEQAEREFGEAYRAWAGQSASVSSQTLDYALWSAAGYADAAERLVRDLPVWEA